MRRREWLPLFLVGSTLRAGLACEGTNTGNPMGVPSETPEPERGDLAGRRHPLQVGGAVRLVARGERGRRGPLGFG